MNENKINLIKDKEVYKPAEIRVITVQIQDIITTSGGFSGDDDVILPQDNFS